MPPDRLPVLCYPQDKCLRATPNGCTTGRPGSPRWTTTAWCVRWSGAWSGRKIGHAATALVQATCPKIARSFCASSTSASSRPATSSIPTPSRRIFAWSGARCRSSARARFPMRAWKRKCVEPMPNFCALPHRCVRHTRKIIWSTRAGSRLEGAEPWFCCRTGMPMRWLTASFCRVLNWLGIAVLRLSMPYHDIRKPEEIHRADYAVSANIGRTLDACRQGVIDARCCLDWLEQQGYSQFGIVGTSLGSCYAFLAAAHDSRIRACAFNHASTWVADVVWHGQSTRHIREGLESKLISTACASSGLAVSPMSYFSQFARWPRKSLIIYAKYDLTFLPELSARDRRGVRTARAGSQSGCAPLRPLHDRRNAIQIHGWLAVSVFLPNRV